MPLFGRPTKSGALENTRQFPKFRQAPDDGCVRFERYAF